MKNNNSINLSWWIKQKGENFGDALNPILAKYISGKDINLIEVGDPSSTPRYYCIGSILQSSMSTESEIWGAWAGVKSRKYISDPSFSYLKWKN